MENLQTSTVRVPKEILDSIKIYTKKHGKNVGNWVETAWNFIQKNDFDIYDQETTPFLPVAEPQSSQSNEVKALCTLMAEFITAQKQLPSSDDHGLIASFQDQIAKKDAELAQVRTEKEQTAILLEKARNELRRLKKGVFGRPDSDVLEELGIY